MGIRMVCCKSYKEVSCTVFLFSCRKYHIEFGVLDKINGVAYGTYDDSIDSTGYV